MPCDSCKHFDPGDGDSSGQCTYDVSDIKLPASVGLPMPIVKSHVTPRSGRNCVCFDECQQVSLVRRAMAKLSREEIKALGL